MRVVFPELGRYPRTFTVIWKSKLLFACLPLVRPARYPTGNPGTHRTIRIRTHAHKLFCVHGFTPSSSPMRSDPNLVSRRRMNQQSCADSQWNFRIGSRKAEKKQQITMNIEHTHRRWEEMGIEIDEAYMHIAHKCIWSPENVPHIRTRPIYQRSCRLCEPKLNASNAPLFVCVGICMFVWVFFIARPRVVASLAFSRLASARSRAYRRHFGTPNSNTG